MAYDPFEYVDFTRPDHTGRVILSHEGRSVAFRFPWSVIREIQIDWGLEEVDREDPEANQDNMWSFVADALDRGDIEKLAILVGYSGTVDGEESVMGYERALELSLPVQPTRLALRAAWAFAWNGGEQPEESEGLEDETGKKRVNILTTLFASLLKTRLKPGADLTNSGD